MNHLQHFGLTQDPFSNEPDLRFYFDSVCHRDAMMRVERGLRQNKGLTVLSGEPGTGKTLLARRLLESLEEEIFEAVLMVMLPGATDAQTVLTRFAKQLGVEEPGADRSSILAQIYEQLAIIREEGRHAVLIIDDAQILGPVVMAEIGGLLNLEYEDSRLLSLLLVGSPDIEQCMSGDASLHQRVDVRVRLQPLGLDDTAAYLAHRLTIVGGRIPMIPSPTIEALYKYSRGRPRLINTLADNALFEASLTGSAQVDARDVERAAGDLGIGTDPGETYSAFASPTPGVNATSSDSQLPSPDASADPSSISVFDTIDPSGADRDPATPEADPDADSATDIGSLLEVDAVPTEELTTVLGGPSPEDGETFDLDAEVNAVLAERDDAGDLDLPVFEASNTGQSTAEATRIAFSIEPEAEQSDEVAELDDLFVELIED